MKILYDHQIFTMQTVGGVSRYFSELLKGLRYGERTELNLSLKYSNNIYLREFGFDSHRTFFKNYPFKGRRRIQRILNNWNSRSDIIQGDYDLFHPTYYHPYHLSYSTHKPLVLTVYDMIHEKFPELFPSTDNTALVKRKLVNRADKIIAISESTKKDLIDILHVNAEKIEVVYLANSLPDKRSEVTEEKSVVLPQKFIFFVGRRSEYKNFHRFLNAAVRLLKTDEELEIVCTASQGFGKKENEHFGKLGISGRIHSYYFNENQLRTAYEKASVFVFPSLYEGFGLPLLESFAASCPVVCSNSSSLPEIAKNAALYFDPFSEQEIEDSISQVLYNEDLRHQLIKNGRERLKKFTWEKTVDETIDVYKSVLT